MGGSRNNNGGKTAEAAAAASGTANTVVALVLLLVAASAVVFLLSPPTPAATRIGRHGDGGPRREPVELAIGLAGHESWLDAVRAWAKLACLKLRPPEPREKVAWCCSRNGAAVEVCILTAACVCQGTICAARRR
ncbi:uncharacterized protein [Oryza sativa Japonica Group]|uniref:uncharacterized protein isoform X2 n=1 Tax=Oryza sativa subsp. japonica TaxID=39947 RepID=UPI0007754B1F|nr:uncharacterized protein LOC107278388 isoform X2 [Oryza sativa Japonica Group]KAF2924027.1 hypothetical protein DAI22_07g237500 [Oryza sativa Japonica Group]